jgi:3-deoxy-D-manno-octulosonate 8-phosphate phosphatase KdsC-like HAD superfamily phosphatase
VADAVFAVKRIADYVTRRAGGCGAVAEVVELLLRKQRRWSRALLTQL